MEITIIGFVQIALGLAFLLFGNLRSAFALLLFSALLGGSAALQLPAVGGSSIRPAELALLFVLLRILMPGGGYVGFVPEAVTRNFWLVSFTVFGVASAIVAPRIFSGTIDVFPMSYGESRNLFDTVPLRPTSQNLTAVFYLTGTLAAAIAAYVVCRFAGGIQTLVSAVVVLGWMHVLIGLAATAARDTPADAVFEFFRNGNYAQMDNAYGSFVRIRGIFPEAAAYTKFAFAMFAANAELWYRSIRTRATGAAALALAMTMFFSTSSTAYVGLAGYGLFWVLRVMFFPFPGVERKVKAMLLMLGLLMVCTALVMAAVPSLPAAMLDMLQHMTVDKSDSDSGRQRLFWAMQGWYAFQHSYGLGIGPGSFRSSSIVTAMVGSVGIIGTAAFVLYLVSVFQPGRRSTVMATGNLALDQGSAFASAALVSLIPAAVESAQAQPGVLFAIFAGAALAMRQGAVARPGQSGTSPAGHAIGTFRQPTAG